MAADDFAVSADEVAEAGDKLVLELFDPTARRRYAADVRSSNY